MNAPENQPEADFAEDSAQALSAFLPLSLLALSLMIVLGWQVSNSNSQRNLLQQGITNREPVLQQARQAQAGLQKLVVDLIDASKDDNDAIAIIAKYNVQIAGKPVVTAGPAAPVGPASAASPAATTPAK